MDYIVIGLLALITFFLASISLGVSLIVLRMNGLPDDQRKIIENNFFAILIVTGLGQFLTFLAVIIGAIYGVYWIFNH